MSISSVKSLGRNRWAEIACVNTALTCFRYDSVIGVVAEHDGTTERLVEAHQTFGNNFCRQDSDHPSKSLQVFFSGWVSKRDKGVYDTVVYVLANVFQVSK